MADQRLVDYIIESLRSGYTADYLVQALLNQGWDMNQIREAINAAQGYPPPQPAPAAQPYQTQPAAKSAGAAEPKTRPPRPTGVTIICILGFLGAILMLFAGVLIVFLGQFFDQIMGVLPLGNETFPLNITGLTGAGEFGSLSGFLGMAFIILAIVDFAGFYLLWKMKKIGWIIITVVGVLTITLYAINFSINYIVSIILFAVIVVYLLTQRKLFV
jgi:hypothetical protein